MKCEHADEPLAANPSATGAAIVELPSRSR
jgi:hypothetical protein